MATEAFQKLARIMARLRLPGGCPWDNEQSLKTLRRYLIEEAYEVLDAMEREDWTHLAEELGDLQLQVVFQAQIAAEGGHFTIADVLEKLNEKLIRRHPHVFADGEADTPGAVVKRWEEIKAEEKAAKGETPAEESILDVIPRTQPATLEAWEIGKRAAKTGFDWPELDGLWDKLREETDEVNEAIALEDADAIEAEVGDLLFVAVNVARFLKVNPELALRRTNAKFRKRFAAVEAGLRAEDKSPDDATLEEMEALWQRAKLA